MTRFAPRSPSGAIPATRLDDAAARVLELKRKLGLLKHS